VRFVCSPDTPLKIITLEWLHLKGTQILADGSVDIQHYITRWFLSLFQPPGSGSLADIVSFVFVYYSSHLISESAIRWRS